MIKLNESEALVTPTGTGHPLEVRTRQRMDCLVSDSFAVPQTLVTSQFRLEPLTGRHNESDHEAWTSSIQYIRNDTPGFPLTEHDDWPPERGMDLASNLRDLEQHHNDFQRRVGFTYTVLTMDATTGGSDSAEQQQQQQQEQVVVGCVYIYPDASGKYEAEVKSWVRESHSQLDCVLRNTVAGWMSDAWPFASIRYEGLDEADRKR